MSRTKFTGKCAMCGAEIDAGANHQRRYCPECARKHEHERQRARYEERCAAQGKPPPKRGPSTPKTVEYDTVSKYAPNLDRILKADKKPPWCSDQRWRMELRRRAMLKRLGEKYCGAGAAHRMSAATRDSGFGITRVYDA